MMECWDLNPNSRPTFTKIVECIQHMIAFRDVSYLVQPSNLRM